MENQIETSSGFDEIIIECEKIRIQKRQDYANAWKILRLTSITDQIFIKAQRIRSVQEKGEMRVNEKLDVEFMAIINYSAMALYLHKKTLTSEDLESNPKINSEDDADFKKIFYGAKCLMGDKNHDYGEAWRKMRISSMVDLILMKILRVKQIENNKGETLISENVDANYNDMINYCVFSLIKIKEGTNPMF